MQSVKQALSSELDVKIDTNNITSTIQFSSEHFTLSLNNMEARMLIELIQAYGESIVEDIATVNQNLERQAYQRMQQVRRKEEKQFTVKK